MSGRANFTPASSIAIALAFRRSDPDRQDPLSLPLLQDDDRRVGRAIEPEVGHPHFDHDR